MKLRIAFIFLSACLLPAPLLRAQQPTVDQACMHIASLFVEGDYMEIARCYPALRDSLPPVLREISEATTAYISGRPTESNAAIQRVVGEYAEQAGLQNTVTLLNLAVYNYRTLNDYAGAGRTIREMLARLPEGVKELDGVRASLEAFDDWISAFAEWPATTVRRPEGEVVLPLDLQKAGRGEHIVLDTEVNGHTEPFIFDTGCSGSNFVTEAAAERMGIRTLADSVPVTGMSTLYAKAGVADSLRIGSITILHPTFIIVPEMSAESVDGLCEATIGSDIIRGLGEIRIEANRGRIVLPAAPSAAPQAPNLIFSGGLYYLDCMRGNERLLFQFDTGNVKSTLTKKFYTAHRSEIRSEGEKTTSVQGGLGDTRTLKVYVLPELMLDTPLRPVTLRDITANIREKGLAVEREFESGSLGVDFLRACDAVTIDLGRMFVRTE